MFENLLKIALENEYAVATRESTHPFVILQDGAMMIYDELLGISADEFSFDDFCNNFSKKYNVDKSMIEEDLELVLNALKFDFEDTDNPQVSFDDTYQYAYGFYNQQDKIFKAFFELTYACNLKCKHCYLGDDINSYKTSVTFENAKRVIDEMQQLGVIDLTFTGGECFSHPDALKIIEYASSRSFVISILTNGTYLGKELIERIAQLPIHSLRVSLYGTEEFHDEFVGVKGSFSKSVNALIELDRIRKNLVMATSVITRDNINDIIRLNGDLNKLGIEHKLTCLIFPTVKGDLSPISLRISREEINKLMQMGLLNFSGSTCNSGISRIRIAPNGDVNPCELFRDVKFGNIFNESLELVLQSESRKNWITQLRNAMEKSSCNSCDKKKSCPGCIGLNYLETGVLDKRNNFLCDIAEAKIENFG